MKKGICLLLCILLSMTLWLPAMAVGEDDEVDSSLPQIQINMAVERSDDGTVTAVLIDSNDNTMWDWPVELTIDGETVESGRTSESGQVTFETIVAQDARNVACVADSEEYSDDNGSVYYVGCTVYVPESVVSPTTAQTAASRAPITISDDLTMTYAPVTTAVNGDKIGVGVDFDNGVLNTFQLTIDDFNARSRMWMDKSVYEAMVSEADATVHLKMIMNADAATKEQLIAAKNADAAYASYADTQVKGFAMNLSVEYITGSDHLEIDPVEGMYQIELPVPDSMKSCEKLAVAVCTSNGLASLVEVPQSGGVIDFTIQKFQTLALVGFYSDSAALSTLVQTPWLLIVLIVIGVLLVAGGIVLVILVVLRRRKKDDEPEDDGKRHILIVPTSEEDPVDVTAQNGPEEDEQEVIMDLDDQTELPDELREIFRAKADAEEQPFDQLKGQAFSPAQQLKTVDTPLPEQPKKNEEDTSLTVDDILNEFYEDK